MSSAPIATVSPARHPEWELLPAAQQPEWRDHPRLNTVRRELAGSPPLVHHRELVEFEGALARVAQGHARLLQVGDCVESFAESTTAHTLAKIETVDLLAARLALRTGQEVVRVGRIGGQLAKPRSAMTEVVDGIALPAFRGHLINSENTTAVAREHNPDRMVIANRFSRDVLDLLRLRREASGDPTGPWASHEALVIDYESPLVRVDPTTTEVFLSSTHLPWVGERTRQLGGAHIALLSSVRNPVGCKIGPSARPDTVVRLCDRLNPHRRPGKLVLVARMGRSAVTEALRPVVRAVRRAGHPVVWLTDPMHGNTIRTATGLKTRTLTDLVAEVRSFTEVLEDEGVHPGGLHLETAAGPVTECVGSSVPDEAALARRYESLCDPRLNPEQALALIDSTT